MQPNEYRNWKQEMSLNFSARTSKEIVLVIDGARVPHVNVKVMHEGVDIPLNDIVGVITRNIPGSDEVRVTWPRSILLIIVPPVDVISEQVRVKYPVTIFVSNIIKYLVNPASTRACQNNRPT